MSLTNVFDSNRPLNSSLDVLKEHYEKYFDGLDHDGIEFPDADIYFEEKEFGPEVELEKAQIRIQIVTGQKIDVRNGNEDASGNIERNTRRTFDIRTTCTTSRDTGGNRAGEELSSNIKDLVMAQIFGRYIVNLEKAGLESPDIGVPVKIPHKQLWIWNLSVLVEVNVSHRLIETP